jgi:hypothetical protein
MSQDTPAEVVVFEYGGGGTEQKGRGGGLISGFFETVCCFNILKDLTYRTVILVDSLPDSMEKVFDLSEHDISPDAIFYPQAVYGNAICFRNCIMDVSWVNGICTHYRNNQSHHLLLCQILFFGSA